MFLCYRMLAECSKAELFIQSLNRIVVFLKEKGIVFTNENLRIAINLDFTAYEDIISTVRLDVLLVKKQKKI
jgi:hypothetical protein